MDNILQLHNLQHLFKNEESLREFVRQLKGVVHINKDALILYKQDLVCAAITGKDAQKRIQRRIVKKLRENPELLDKIID